MAEVARFGDNTGSTMTYPGTQDCDLEWLDDDSNSGASVYLISGDYNSAAQEYYAPLLAFDLASFWADHPDAVITEAKLYLYCIQRIVD